MIDNIVATILFRLVRLDEYFLSTVSSAFLGSLFAIIIAFILVSTAVSSFVSLIFIFICIVFVAVFVLFRFNFIFISLLVVLLYIVAVATVVISTVFIFNTRTVAKHRGVINAGVIFIIALVLCFFG